MKPLVYVAGPISGDPYGCIRQAADAFDVLRAAGCVPFLPQLSVLHAVVNDIGYDGWLSYDFDVIRHCQGLVRLQGVSPGADREMRFAQDELGLPVFVLPSELRDVERWASRAAA